MESTGEARRDQYRLASAPGELEVVFLLKNMLLV
jgi:hypothetical protein